MSEEEIKEEISAAFGTGERLSVEGPDGKIHTTTKTDVDHALSFAFSLQNETGERLFHAPNKNQESVISI